MSFILGLLVGSLITTIVISVGLINGDGDTYDYDGFEDTK